jgi:hypothetical protein
VSAARRAASAKRGPNTEHANNIRRAHAAGYRVEDDGRIISPNGVERATCSRGAYQRFSIRVGKRYRTVSVHKLAAYQWFGEAALQADVHVRHLDGNPQNNSRENIALGSPRDNIMDRSPEERKTHARKANSSRRRLTDAQVRLIREFVADGAPAAEVARVYGLAKSTVSYIVNRKTYAEVS